LQQHRDTPVAIPRFPFRIRAVNLDELREVYAVMQRRGDGGAVRCETVTRYLGRARRGAVRGNSTPWAAPVSCTRDPLRVHFGK